MSSPATNTPQDPIGEIAPEVISPGNEEDGTPPGAVALPPAEPLPILDPAADVQTPEQALSREEADRQAYEAWMKEVDPSYMRLQSTDSMLANRAVHNQSDGRTYVAVRINYPARDGSDNPDRSLTDRYRKRGFIEADADHPAYRHFAKKDYVIMWIPTRRYHEIREEGYAQVADRTVGRLRTDSGNNDVRLEADTTTIKDAFDKFPNNSEPQTDALTEDELNAFLAEQ